MLRQPGVVDVARQLGVPPESLAGITPEREMDVKDQRFLNRQPAIGQQLDLIFNISDILGQIADQKLAKAIKSAKDEEELAQKFGEEAWIDPDADLTFR